MSSIQWNQVYENLTKWSRDIDQIVKFWPLYFREHQWPLDFKKFYKIKTSTIDYWLSYHLITHSYFYDEIWPRYSRSKLTNWNLDQKSAKNPVGEAHIFIYCGFCLISRPINLIRLGSLRSRIVGNRFFYNKQNFFLYSSHRNNFFKWF